MEQRDEPPEDNIDVSGVPSLSEARSQRAASEKPSKLGKRTRQAAILIPGGRQAKFLYDLGSSVLGEVKSSLDRQIGSIEDEISFNEPPTKKRALTPSQEKLARQSRFNHQLRIKMAADEILKQFGDEVDIGTADVSPEDVALSLASGKTERDEEVPAEIFNIFRDAGIQSRLLGVGMRDLPKPGDLTQQELIESTKRDNELRRLSRLGLANSEEAATVLRKYIPRLSEEVARGIVTGYYDKEMNEPAGEWTELWAIDHGVPDELLKQDRPILKMKFPNLMNIMTTGTAAAILTSAQKYALNALPYAWNPMTPGRMGLASSIISLLSGGGPMGAFLSGIGMSAAREATPYVPEYYHPGQTAASGIEWLTGSPMAGNWANYLLTMLPGSTHIMTEGQLDPVMSSLISAAVMTGIGSSITLPALKNWAMQTAIPFFRRNVTENPIFLEASDSFFQELTGDLPPLPPPAPPPDTRLAIRRHPPQKALQLARPKPKPLRRSEKDEQPPT